MDNRLSFFAGESDVNFISFKSQISDKKIIVFGAGRVGRIICNVFKLHNMEINYVVDNDRKKWGSQIYGIDIYDPNVLVNESKPYTLIFIASSFYDEISSQLKEIRFSENVHFFDGLRLLEFLNTYKYTTDDALGDYIRWIEESESKVKSDSSICIKNREIRACHLDDLFIRNDGFVFPCCRLRSNENYIIGHLNDPDLYTKIKDYEGSCSCNKYELRKIIADEKLKFRNINIEFSLLCQAQCAMCCVDAPGNNCRYKYFDELRKLINDLMPDGLTVQGGEVLVQDDTIAFLREIKCLKQDINISIITNSNCNLNKVSLVEEVFDNVHVSMVGFQKETYKRIMGLDINKTMNFIDALVERKKVDVSLKYLITPLNVHELGLFLEWAIMKKPSSISIADSNIDQYINYETWDDFWRKVIERTAVEVKKVLIAKREILIKNGIVIYIDYNSRKMYGLDDDYIHQNGLDRIIEIFV